MHNNRKIAIRFSDSDVVVIMVSIMTQSMEYKTGISVVIEFGSKESLISMHAMNTLEKTFP